MAFDFAKTADRIVELQDKASIIMAKAASQTKPLYDEIKDLEESLFLAMQDSNLSSIKGSNSEASIKTTLRVSIDDYEALEKFILRKKAIHMFERRISTKAYAEMKESLGNKDVPGLKEYHQPRLTVKASK